MPVIDSSGAPGRQEHNNLLLKEVMAAALDVFRVCVEYFTSLVLRTTPFSALPQKNGGLETRLNSLQWLLVRQEVG